MVKLIVLAPQGDMISEMYPLDDADPLSSCWPTSSYRFTYIGIDPKQGTLRTMIGETLNSLGPFQEDLYGCHGKLREKKLQRNPFRRR